MIAEKLLDLAQPPTCLHALGQSLVDAMWREGQALKHELETLQSIKSGDSDLSESERMTLAFKGFKKGVITYGEYLAVCAAMVRRFEQRQPMDTPWDYSDEYKKLCMIEPNVFH